MADFSINLPSWAVRKGYRAEGDYGTYGYLLLYKGCRCIRAWGPLERQPSIFEVEEIIKKYEDEGL